jgi:hypothetical protein
VCKIPLVGGFERADLANAFLRGFIKEKAERARLVCAMHDLKGIYFVGSFVNHEIVRRTYTEVLTFCNYFFDAANKKVSYLIKLEVLSELHVSTENKFRQI